MKKRTKLIFVSVMTVLTVALAVLLSLMPAGTRSATAGSRPTPSQVVYQAGLERAGTNICRCPVTTGDCVCEFGKPPV